MTSTVIASAVQCSPIRGGTDAQGTHVTADEGPQPPIAQPPARESALRECRWFGAGAAVRLGALKVPAPMTYLTDGRHARDHSEPAAVDVALPVAPAGAHSGGRELDYWPRYAALTPHQRRNYLDWLAGGRATIPPELGYTFLFIYGLERRALVEQSDQAAAFDEVLRLRRLYAEGGAEVSRSCDGYTSSFLWFLAAVFPERITADRVERLAATVQNWTESALTSMVSYFAQAAAPLPAWAARAVADWLPGSQRSVVLRRVGDEFRDLFAVRYRTAFPDGLVPRPSKRPLRHAYRPANSAIGEVSTPIPNPLGAPAQFKPLAAIWNGCLQELKKLSSVIAKGGGGPSDGLTSAAWEALPPELRAGTDHPLSDAMCQLVERSAGDDGHVMTAVAQLAATLQIDNKDGPKLTAGQSRKLCETAAHAGYALEPDARLTEKAYRDDEVVAVFLRTTDDEPDPVRYGAAACMLRVGMGIAAADGEIHAEETAVLTQQVRQAFELSDVELRRLEALRALLERLPPDWASLRQMAKGMAPTQREATGRLMLAIVAADGVVTDDELKAVRKGYAALGLSKDEAEGAIASLAAKAGAGDSAPDDALPTIVAAAAAARPGEAIPPPPSQSVGLRLDRAAIAAIMSDTREVAKMLAAAMQAAPDDLPPPLAGNEDRPAAATDTSPENMPAPPELPVAPVAVDVAVVAAAAGPVVTPTDDPTLPARYAAFYRLLVARGRWELREAESLARGHGHMLAGAVEALNEWASERYGGQLFVEEADGLLVEKELLN